MTAGIAIRQYTTSDRAAVREICCETGDRGEPVDNLYSDGAMVADIVTRYYTDFEPESCFVAEAGNIVVGYLTAAMSTRKYARTMAGRIFVPAIAAALRRGTLFTGESWRMFRAGFRNLGSHAKRITPGLDRFPAHIHIDLLKEARGRGVGRELLAAFVELAASLAVEGIHATVRADNPDGKRFFERNRFAGIGGYDVAMPVHGGIHDVHVIIYARKTAVP